MVHLTSNRPPAYSMPTPSSSLTTPSSSHPKPYPSLSKFATLSFDTADKFRLIQFPFQLASAISIQLRQWWPAGIQREQIYATHAYEFKLKGWPFGGMTGGKDNISGMRLVRDLLAFLYQRGWVVETGIAHERSVGATDTLVFRQRRRRVGNATGKGGGEMNEKNGMREKAPEPGLRMVGDGEIVREGEDIVIPPEAEWLVLSLEMADRLRVIYDVRAGKVKSSSEIIAQEAGGSGGGMNEKMAPLALGREQSSSEIPREANYDELGLMIEALKEAFTEIEYFQSGKWTHDSYEFKLKGWAWSEMGEKAVKGRRLLLKIVETLDRFGWRSYATIQKRGMEKARGLDTWFFVREEGWDQ